MTEPDREQLKRDLSDALSAIQQDQAVPDLDVLAASLTTLGPAYAFHGRMMLSSLNATPPHINAIIWNLVQVLDKLEHGVT
jgi:hypothetical protein